MSDINLPAVLKAMNKRLEWLLSRDHLIGHAWLMEARSKDDVDRIMRHKIIPMLAEYFHEDWNRVCAVLGGDGFIERKKLGAPPELDDAGHRRRPVPLDGSRGFSERRVRPSDWRQCPAGRCKKRRHKRR